MTIFPILNDEQRVATGWGLRTSQTTLFVEDFPYEKMLIKFRGVSYERGFSLFVEDFPYERPSIFRGHSFVEFSRSLGPEDAWELLGGYDSRPMGFRTNEHPDAFSSFGSCYPTLCPIMVQWKMGPLNERKRSYWRYTPFPLPWFFGGRVASLTRALPSLKLTAKAPENGWLEYDSFPFGARPIFRGELLVSGSVFSWEQSHIPSQRYFWRWWFSSFRAWWDMWSFPEGTINWWLW